MNDRGKIILGLILFMIMITSPIWLNIALGESSEGPKIEILTKGVAGKEQCVMSKGEITAEHMDLLNTWRDEVVRTNKRIYRTTDGRQFNKSLTHTCLDCHSNKEKFCDSCHDYTGVEPYCWSCHFEPKELK